MSRVRRTVRQWTAKELTADLCSQLRGDHFLAVTEATLGRGRVDVMALRKTFMTFRPQIFEIKISRGDFLSDIRENKWRKYLDYGPVAFAVPDGLIERKEVPADAGLRVRFESGWRWMKSPRYQHSSTFPYKDELLIRFMLCLGDQYFARGREEAGWRRFDEYQAEQRARTEFAREVMRNMRRLDALKADVKRFEDRANDARERAYDYERVARQRETALYPHRARSAV